MSIISTEGLTSRDHVPVRPRTVMSQKDVTDTFRPHRGRQDGLSPVQERVAARVISFGKMKLDRGIGVGECRDQVARKRRRVTRENDAARGERDCKG